MSTQQTQENPWGEVISTYTRAQALADGFLVDVSEVAREAGFVWPVALTSRLWAAIETIPPKYRLEDVQGRLWDVLWMASRYIKHGHDLFKLILHTENDLRRRMQETVFRATVGPGDDGEPVITLGFPDED